MLASCASIPTGDDPATDTGERMHWFYLLLAGLLEVGWAVGLKYSNGLSKLIPSLITFTLMALSIALLALAMKHLPLGTAYAIWTGIGAVGAAIVGIIVFNEAASLPRLLSLACIVVGLIGLKLATPA